MRNLENCIDWVCIVLGTLSIVGTVYMRAATEQAVQVRVMCAGCARRTAGERVAKQCVRLAGIAG
jgi:hypothetical protein